MRLVGCLLLLGVSAAHAVPPAVVVLITEDRLEGPPRFWWRCDAAREPQPLVDALAAQLGRTQARVLSHCEDAPIHGSFGRPHLAARDGVNIASALDADLAVVGTVHLRRAPSPEGLGVVRITAALDVQVLRGNGVKVAAVSVTRDGFGSDVAAALVHARQLLLADALEVLPAALDARVATPRLWVKLDAGGGADARLRFRDALARVQGVSRVALAAVRRDTTTFSVEPPEVRYAVASALAEAGVTYQFVEEP